MNGFTRLLGALVACFVTSVAYAQQWGGWENLGGTLRDKPECVSWDFNRIDCFARGTDRAMYHRWWDGSRWGGWENLGGTILEEPSWGAWGTDRVDCFARGTNGGM